MSLVDLSPRQLALVSMLVSVSATVCYYFVLRHAGKAKHAPLMWTLPAFFLLAIAAPVLVPDDLRNTSRLLAALFTLMLVFKMWDMWVSAKRGDLPGLQPFLAYLPNLFLIVWRKQGAERQPAMWRNVRNLLVAMFNLAGSYFAITLLHRLDWSGQPFLLAHVLIASCLLWGVVGALDLLVPVTRLVGAYCNSANDKPYLARTPAEFWRRYNRIVGQFLHENVFKLADGRRHPVRAMMLAFFISGLFHEYLLWLAIGRSPGLQMTFFLLQGTAVAATLRVRPRGANSI